MRALIAAAALTGCQYLEEQRETPTEVVWSGDLFVNPVVTDLTVLEGGGLLLTDDDDGSVYEGDEYEDSPGSYKVTVPVGRDVLIEVTGDGVAPTLWRGQTPEGRAYWFDGGLFGIELAGLDAWLASVVEAGILDEAPTSLDGAAVAHLMGQPLSPDDWVGAEVTVTGGDGEPATVLLLTTDDDGSTRVAGVEDPIDLFFASECAPGDVSLTVTTATGGVTTLQWPAEGGDLLSAFYLTLASES